MPELECFQSAWDREPLAAGEPLTAIDVWRRRERVAAVLNYLRWLADTYPYRPLTAGAIAILIDGYIGEYRADANAVLQQAGLPAHGFSGWPTDDQEANR